MNYFQTPAGGAAMSVAPLPTLQAMPNLNDSIRFINEGLIAPVVDGLRQAVTNFVDTMGARTDGLRVPQHRFARPRGCCDEAPDPCHCNCCIVDADLIVYARIGERRVVPLTIENPWRRERPVKLELSGFSSRGGAASPVIAGLGPPAPAFTLPPCGRQTIVMTIETGRTAEGNEAPADVDDCIVCYADLRIEGCEIRPVRIAVALLPRDCGDFRITCGCRCCC